MRSTREILLETLRRRLAEWSPALPWGVGYSGGRDSGVLLWALVEVGGPQAVVALHVDHGWRGEGERRAEAALVAGYCSRLGVELRSFGPPGAPASSGLSSEAEARAHRYRCFQTFLEAHPHSPVFLAHHADDQAETILMRVLQGRSWGGLAGIPARRGPYLRPLLGLRASVLAEVAAEAAIEFHHDSTNDGARPLRNFLRLEVLPVVVQRFPRAVEALGDLGRTWSHRSPASVDPAWVVEEQGGRVDVALWSQWSLLERQGQLLAVAQRLGTGRLPRRFVETVARSTRGQGAGWSWWTQGGQLHWYRVVPEPLKEYFIEVVPQRWYDVGKVRMRWGREPGPWAVPALDPARPWVCRSAAPGLRYASDDDPDWGKETRRRRLGPLGPLTMLVVQDGRLKAVFDLQRIVAVWREKAGEKLNNDGIFVTLEKRSDYERR